MITDELVREMEAIVGKTHVSSSRAVSELYSYDASLAKGKPGVVVFPADGDEASQVVRAAHRAGVSFVPRGFGTNLSGGTIVTDEGVVLCLTRLNRILGIHPESRYAVVQPGVTNLELQDALGALGYFYAPDPASQKVATLGGNLGENSGGPRCLKYGVTTNHILGMEMILPDGEIVRTGGAALDPPGLDLRGVMVGSEGTLGIVTEITVRILPMTEKVITMLAIYDAIADAAESVSRIISAGIVPNTLEMMDATVIKAVEDSYACGYPRDAAAVLIIEVEGPSAGLAEQAERIRDICMETRCREIQEAKGDAERNRLWQGRRGAFGAVARLAPNYLVNDATVPRTKLPEALARVAEISKRHGFEHGNVLHAGDGNLHPLLLFDSRNEEQLHRVEKAGWEIMQACVDLGGTISGEHGIGLEKQEAMRLIFSEDDMELQRGVKRAFDPADVLNPGKALPKPAGTRSSAETNGGSTAEICDAIRRAASERQSVRPAGRGTFSGYGNLVAPDAVRLDSSSLARVIEYDAANQMITVEAGMSLKVLQDHLQVRCQWLPVRPPFFEETSTIGRLVALAACGPERLMYGAPRDLLLGLRFIDSKGRLISAGGKVVKNVAGYDMTRLMTGSAGTLGFITQATWRVSTIPERCAAITAEGSLDVCAEAARDVLASKCLPGFVASHEAGSGEWQLVIGFEGFSRTVDYQLEKCLALLEKGGMEVLDQGDYPLHAGKFSDVCEAMAPSPFILRGDVRLSGTADFFEALSGKLNVSSKLLDYGCGRILAGVRELSGEQWAELSELAKEYDGHVLLEKAPDDFRRENDVFGRPSPAWKMMHRTKRELDPDNVFSPGGMPGRV